MCVTSHCNLNFCYSFLFRFFFFLVFPTNTVFESLSHYYIICMCTKRLTSDRRCEETRSQLQNWFRQKGNRVSASDLLCCCWFGVQEIPSLVTTVFNVQEEKTDWLPMNEKERIRSDRSKRRENEDSNSSPCLTWKLKRKESHLLSVRVEGVRPPFLEVFLSQETPKF